MCVAGMCRPVLPTAGRGGVQHRLITGRGQWVHTQASNVHRTAAPLFGKTPGGDQSSGRMSGAVDSVLAVQEWHGVRRESRSLCNAVQAGLGRYRDGFRGP